MADEKKITFNNVFLPSFRNVAADGAYIGLTPRGYITINFYITKGPIPASVQHEIQDSGKLGKTIQVEENIKGSSIERQFEVGIVLDVTAARDLVELLNKNINSALEQLNLIKTLPQ